jgi:hypothetical protein
MITISSYIAEHCFFFTFFTIGFYVVFEVTYTVLGDLFDGERYVPEKKQEAPKKVYRPKSEFIQKLLSEGKAKEIYPALFIEDHTFNGSKLLFKNHDEKCEFLSICDIIQYHDGFITDFEIGQIAVTKKLVAN